MNCTEMVANFSLYSQNDPIRLQIQRECFSDGITIIVTIIVILIAILSTIFDNIN